MTKQPTFDNSITLYIDSKLVVQAALTSMFEQPKIIFSVAAARLADNTKISLSKLRTKLLRLHKANATIRIDISMNGQTATYQSACITFVSQVGVIKYEEKHTHKKYKRELNLMFDIHNIVE